MRPFNTGFDRLALGPTVEADSAKLHRLTSVPFSRKDREAVLVLLRVWNDPGRIIDAWSGEERGLRRFLKALDPGDFDAFPGEIIASVAALPEASAANLARKSMRWPVWRRSGKAELAYTILAHMDDDTVRHLYRFQFRRTVAASRVQASLGSQRASLVAALLDPDATHERAAKLATAEAQIQEIRGLIPWRPTPGEALAAYEQLQSAPREVRVDFETRYPKKWSAMALALPRSVRTSPGFGFEHGKDSDSSFLVALVHDPTVWQPIHSKDGQRLSETLRTALLALHQLGQADTLAEVIEQHRADWNNSQLAALGYPRPGTLAPASPVPKSRERHGFIERRSDGAVDDDRGIFRVLGKFLRGLNAPEGEDPRNVLQPGSGDWTVEFPVHVPRVDYLAADMTLRTRELSIERLHLIFRRPNREELRSAGKGRVLDETTLSEVILSSLAIRDLLVVSDGGLVGVARTRLESLTFKGQLAHDTRGRIWNFMEMLSAIATTIMDIVAVSMIDVLPAHDPKSQVDLSSALAAHFDLTLLSEFQATGLHLDGIVASPYGAAEHLEASLFDDTATTDPNLWGQNKRKRASHDNPERTYKTEELNDEYYQAREAIPEPDLRHQFNVYDPRATDVRIYDGAGMAPVDIAGITAGNLRVTSELGLPTISDDPLVALSQTTRPEYKATAQGTTAEVTDLATTMTLELPETKLSLQLTEMDATVTVVDGGADLEVTDAKLSLPSVAIKTPKFEIETAAKAGGVTLSDIQLSAHVSPLTPKVPGAPGRTWTIRNLHVGTIAADGLVMHALQRALTLRLAPGIPAVIKHFRAQAVTIADDPGGVRVNGHFTTGKIELSVLAALGDWLHGGLSAEAEGLSVDLYGDGSTWVEVKKPLVRLDSGRGLYDRDTPAGPRLTAMAVLDEFPSPEIRADRLTAGRTAQGSIFLDAYGLNVDGLYFRFPGGNVEAASSGLSFGKISLDFEAGDLTQRTNMPTGSWLFALEDASLESVQFYIKNLRKLSTESSSKAEPLRPKVEPYLRGLNGTVTITIQPLAPLDVPGRETEIDLLTFTIRDGYLLIGKFIEENPLLARDYKVAYWLAARSSQQIGQIDELDLARFLPADDVQTGAPASSPSSTESLLPALKEMVVAGIDAFEAKLAVDLAWSVRDHFQFGEGIDLRVQMQDDASIDLTLIAKSHEALAIIAPFDVALMHGTVGKVGKVGKVDKWPLRVEHFKLGDTTTVEAIWDPKQASLRATLRDISVQRLILIVPPASEKKPPP